jgi:hypothetical protein
MDPNFLIILVLLIVVLFAFGVKGLPDKARDNAERMQEMIRRMEQIRRESNDTSKVDFPNWRWMLLITALFFALVVLVNLSENGVLSHRQVVIVIAILAVWLIVGYYTFRRHEK